MQPTYVTELGEDYMHYVIVGLEQNTLSFLEDYIHFQHNGKILELSRV